jgi:ATP-binding cassette subfamily B protein
MGEVKYAKDRRRTILRLWNYLRHQKLAMIVSAAVVAVGSGVAVVGPWLQGVAIDRYIVKRDLPGLLMICGLMLLTYLLQSGLTWIQQYLMAGVSQRTVREIRNHLFARLQQLPLRYFDSQPHGELMSRLTNDVENVNMVLTNAVSQIVSGILTMVFVASFMFALNPLLAGVTIVTVASTTLVVNKWVVKYTRQGFRMQQAALGSMNGLIEETITGQRVVKAYHREPIVLQEFDKANADLKKAAMQAQVFSGLIGPMMNCLGNMSIAIVAGIGGVMAVQGMATVGTIASFLQYTRHFGRPLNEIASLYNSIQSALAGAERVFEVIDEQPEIDALDAKPLTQIKGDVVFENVNFSYDPERPVLKNVSLQAKAGQTVALVGPTGAGKTTIVNLLTRFYEVDGGSILIDGQSITELKKADLRRQLGIVLQDTFLFTGTVRDNIRYGRLDATDDQIKEAARLSNADQFIHRLPHGYETVLSERAGNLSHGQRQLLAIARAILADPSILILDEATSSVDTRTERHIQEATMRLMAGRTNFVIAHRLSTIRDADQILVINDGQVIERGTHDELLAQKGFYYRLHNG